MQDNLDRIRSSLPGMAWPALPGSDGQLLLALQHQLDQTQWWPANQLRSSQFRQLGQLLDHAHATVPFYRERLGRSGYRPGMDMDSRWFDALPCISRTEVQKLGKALHSVRIPVGHAPVGEGQTAGSTGMPVTFLGTAVTQLFWSAFTLRDHLWHRREFSGTLAAIRVIADEAARPPDGTVGQGWGISTDEIYATGPCAMLSIRATLGEQLAWLERHNPHYLLTYPSNLMALARYSRGRNVRLTRLREIRTIGEIVTPQLRDDCRDAWGVPLVDIYSAQELGYIGLQCPESGSYHVQSENVLVEVINDRGGTCGPGEVGRIIVTGLHNFAFPLIRYEIGDYAEVGGPCPCGRGLPVLARIIGRQRNMLVLPSGERRWPLVGYLSEAPVRQYQVVQKSTGRIEVRVVPRHPFTGREEDQIRTLLIEKAFRHPFEIDIVCLEEIPRLPNGKFEEFISEVAG